MLWIEDKPALARIESLGIPCVTETIKAEQINRKLSRANTARQERINKDRVEGIVASIFRGDPIPAIVVRKLPNGQFVIAGGNHRDEACVVVGEAYREAYVIVCTDAEFLILCRSLNCVVGEGAPKSVRVHQAADAVETEMLSRKDAAREFLVSTNAIGAELRSRAARRKINEVIPGKKLDQFPRRSFEILSMIQADSVLKAAVELMGQWNGNKADVDEIIRKAVKLPTEHAMLNAISTAAQQHTKCLGPVKSRKQTSFIYVLSRMENTIATYKIRKISDLELADDGEEVRARCNALANILNSL